MTTEENCSTQEVEQLTSVYNSDIKCVYANNDQSKFYIALGFIFGSERSGIYWAKK